MELGRDCLPMLISDHKRHRLQYNNVMYLRIGPQAPLVASNVNKTEIVQEEFL